MDDALRDLSEAAERAGLHEHALSAVRETIRLTQLDRQLRLTMPERIARVEQAAARALNSEEKAWWFLRTPQRVLNAVPLDLVATGDEGARRVEQALGRMEHGVYT